MTRLRDVLFAHLRPSAGPGSYPSAVVLLAGDGFTGVPEAYGDAVRYGVDGALLPAPRRVPAQTDTLYDLASLTKTVTAVTVLRLAERGLLSVDEPAVARLPAFTGDGRDDVTVRQLLDHTAGLPATVDLWRRPGPRGELVARLAAVPLEHRPGTRRVYSDLGPMLAGALVERVTGARLDEVVAELVTEYLGMRNTLFSPDERLRERCAATEVQPWTGRGMVHGEVHDENAWALGGIAGHAGLFGTARDVALLAGFVAGSAVGERMRAGGLGVETGQVAQVGGLGSSTTASHTGFTGTSFVVDVATGRIGVLLTNRVHPRRSAGAVTASRVAVAEALLPSHPEA